MHQQFENARNRGNRTELRAFVQDSNVEELVKIIRNSICKTDAPKILDDILQAFSDSDACQSKRRKLVECTLKILRRAKINTSHVDAIINRIIFDFPRYSKQDLVKLVDFCLASIRNDDDEVQSWKDLLPVLLEALENEKYITRIDVEVSGVEYKSLTVKEICNYQWNTNLLPSLAKMFGDMSLEKTNRNEALRALCRALPDLSLDQVPPFVYQVLKLCKDKDSQYLLDTLCKYFECCYSKAVSPEDKDSFDDIGVVNIKEVRDVESTVLYHVHQAAQLNHDNMKDFIRYLKSISHASEYTLQPFVLAVLLSVSDIYEDQIFEILRTAIVNSGLDKEKRQSSAWLRQLLPSPCNIIGVIQQVINSSNKDRHLVLKGLIGLAFMLMSTDLKLKSNATVVWHMGAEIIREVIKKRHETVTIVLQELVDKIVAGGIPTNHYTDCLKYACRELSVIVLDHQIWIVTLLERLLFLPTIVASQVLYAVLPLMHVSPNIRENLLLTLRKALYRKGISKRQMAVTGFLEMLKYSKMHSLSSFRLTQRCNASAYAISSSSRSTLTQVTLESNSQRERPSGEYDKTLCYEILDILKKSFTYEFEVRLHLYQGLYGAITKNPEITESVLDMLVTHLNLYIEADDDVLPPVKFDLCSNCHGTEVILEEPIAELIFVLQKIYVGVTSKNLNTLKKLHDILESLCTRMTATELEHLNLGHGTDLLDDFSKSQIKFKNLSMAIMIYEALMAFQVGEWSKGNRESCRKINNLFKAYTRSVDFIKSQSTKMKKAEGGKSKKDKDTNSTMKKFIKTNNIKIPSTIMDLDTIHQSLLLLYSKSSIQSEFLMLRESRNFSLYIFQTCEQLLQRMKSFMNDISQPQNKQHINTYIEIGGLLYECFLLDLNDAFEKDEQIAILALQCFKEISYCICTSFSSELPRFLNTILRAEKTSASNVDSQVQEIVSSLETYLISSLVEEEDDDTKKKVPFLLLQIVEQFAYKINFEKYNPEKVLGHARKMAEAENVQNTVVPAVAQFLLRLEEYTKNYGETLNDMCLELCEKVGAIDGSELPSSGKYKIIREDTAVQIYNVFNDYVKEGLNNASWLLLRLKAEDTISRASGTINEDRNNNVREKERNLCKQLSYFIQVLHTLVNTSIEPGLSTDVTFKNLQSLYHLLGNLTKYFYAKSNGQNAAFQAVKFIQVVQLAGKPLKSAFYNLVTYVEENQNKPNSKSDTHAQRNKILKETKVIPRVVYEIEQFNKEVLLLGKRTGIPLENYMKHSVTRDFRIKNPQLVEGLEKLDVSMLTPANLEDTENESSNLNLDESTADTEEETPSKKRRKED